MSKVKLKHVGCVFVMLTRAHHLANIFAQLLGHKTNDREGDKAGEETGQTVADRDDPGVPRKVENRGKLVTILRIQTINTYLTKLWCRLLPRAKVMMPPQHGDNEKKICMAASDCVREGNDSSIINSNAN